MIVSVNYANFETAVRKIYIGENRQVGVTLGPGSYLVNGSLEYGNENCHVLIGRYCSLAHRLKFLIGMNHDYCRITTYPFENILDMDMNNSKPYQLNQVDYNQIVIGNDVYIGCDVTIMGGVHIGNGAVIGAETVVTKDVPPYAVVVGNPGRVIKYRFDKEIINKLQQIKWWNWPNDQIKKNLELLSHPNEFIKKYYKVPKAINTDMSRDIIKLKNDGCKILCYVEDFNVEHSIWKSVINQYIEKFSVENKVIFLLCIFFSTDSPHELDEIREWLLKKGDEAPIIIVNTCKENTIPKDVLPYIDYFITNREDTTSLCIDYLAECGAGIVCGLDLWSEEVKV
jgi:virginiamycin A acetyltransferase